MEHLLASWLNPAQLGRMSESTVQSVSLDEVAEVATSSFRSAMGTTPSATREDSLVLILGLLNLGTVLCYAIYAHLFKPFNRFHHPLVDDPQFLYKRIQNIMDELVLHVHTTSYYKRVSEEVPNSSSNTVRSMRGRSAGPKVFNFFSLHDDDSSGVFGSRMGSKGNDQDYQTYLKDQTKKMMKDWLNIVIPRSVTVSGRRLTKRQAPMMRRRRPNFRHINGTRSFLHRQRIEGEQGLRRRSNDSSPLMTKLKSSNRNEQPQIVGGSSSRRPIVSKVETDGPVAVPSSTTPLTISTPAEPDYVTIPSQHVPVHPPAVGASSPPTPSSRIPFPRSGTVNVGLDARAVKKPRLDSLNSGGYQQQPRIPPQDLHQAQSQLQWTSTNEGIPATYPFIGRLMGLIRQTTPLTMDVLGVYDQTRDVANGKCLERLLCQLNQDWKNQGTVSAALAPFLSITTGWWSDGASLSHILMATRAGWIGKHCSSLYPQCPNPSRTQWTLTPSASGHQEPADSMNLPSLDQIPIKVLPPIDFSATITTTVRPSSSSIPPAPSSFRINQHIASKSPAVTTTPVPISTTRDIGIDREGQGVEEEEEDEEDEENDENEEEGGSNVALIPTTGNPISIENQMQSTTERSKPWGKPSRFSGVEDVTLSDIVRGIYSNSEEYDEENLDEEDDEEEEEEEEDTDGSTEQSTSNADILHDLKKHHFTTTTRPLHPSAPTKTTPSRTLLEEAYQEAQKKKTTRLEMVPHRGLVHPWLAEPVWAPDNPWPLRPENNHLRMNEDHEDPSKDRHRDKVSFSQEDAVKDTRLFEFAMQYLRDRSA